MALPGLVITVSDGNLNIVQGSTEDVLVNLGVCTAGTPNVLQAFGSQAAMVATLGAGSLVEKLSYDFSSSGGPVLCMPLSIDQIGAVSAVTALSASGVLTLSSAPVQNLNIIIVAGGSLGTGTFQFSLGSANSQKSAVTTIPASGTFVVPGLYSTVTFASGSYVATNSVIFSQSGAKTTSSGYTSPSISLVSQPLDNFNAQVVVTTAGTPGTAQATYTLDGYDISPPFILPGSSVPYGFSINATLGSGIAGVFTGTFAVGDTFTFASAGPGFDNTSLTTAFTALASTYLDTSYSMVHVVQGGGLTSAIEALTEATTCDAQGTALSALNVFSRYICECPTIGDGYSASGVYEIDTGDTDTFIESEFINFVSARTVVCAGSQLMVSPFTGLTLRRNCAWGVSSRLTAIPAAQDGGWVGAPQGDIPGILLLARDEFKTPALDQARFTTMRTFSTTPGFYITDVKTMASLSSDYQYMTNARVIDRVSNLTAQWALPYINSEVPINTAKNAPAGSISPAYAAILNASLTGFLNNNLVNTSPQDCVSAVGQVDQTNNIISTGKLIITVVVVPFGYAREIVVTIGFSL